jgi:hypothetical protein
MPRMRRRGRRSARGRQQAPWGWTSACGPPNTRSEGARRLSGTDRVPSAGFALESAESARASAFRLTRGARLPDPGGPMSKVADPPSRLSIVDLAKPTRRCLAFADETRSSVDRASRVPTEHSIAFLNRRRRRVRGTTADEAARDAVAVSGLARRCLLEAIEVGAAPFVVGKRRRREFDDRERAGRVGELDRAGTWRRLTVAFDQHVAGGGWDEQDVPAERQLIGRVGAGRLRAVCRRGCECVAPVWPWSWSGSVGVNRRCVGLGADRAAVACDEVCSRSLPDLARLRFMRPLDRRFVEPRVTVRSSGSTLATAAIGTVRRRQKKIRSHRIATESAPSSPRATSSINLPTSKVGRGTNAAAGGAHHIPTPAAGHNEGG